MSLHQIPKRCQFHSSLATALQDASRRMPLSNVREVLDCGDGVKGRPPLWGMGQPPTPSFDARQHL